MSYHALYRAYRPQKFSEVVGQTHIVKTIQNALSHERLSHAYLFCGPRGTGKTSIAKIIAKAVNCEQYPTTEPCNQCANCKGITRGSNPDVFEIDAASNNGVDEIREIRDKVKYAPTTGTYKVYIIDEVHMLSTGAFNALLKTLEEPPTHVIFILATTEPHKIPATIISRCQRFDFKQISTTEIKVHLVNILKTQEVKYHEEAIQLVAQLSDGGMRDALSLLDQVISYADDQITLDDVHALSGTIIDDSRLGIIEGIFKENFAQIIEITQSLIQNGKEPARIIDGLIMTYRNLLTYKKIGISPELLMANHQFIQLSTDLNMDAIVNHLFKLNKLQQDLRFSNHPELMLEVGLLALNEQQTTTEINTDTTKILGQVEHLKKEIATLKKEIKQLELRSVTPQPVKLNVEDAQIKMDLYSQESSAGQLNLESITLPEHIEPEKVTTEQVLSTASKGAKDYVLQKWSQLSPTLMPEYKEIIALLHDGNVVAASDKGFILTYKHEPACNRLLRENNLKIAQQIVSYLFEKSYAFIVMPDSFWLEQRQSYLKQKKQGQNPKLKEYGQKLKNVLNYNEETQPKEKGFIDELVDLYGTELVNIKDEE